MKGRCKKALDLKGKANQRSCLHSTLASTIKVTSSFEQHKLTVWMKEMHSMELLCLTSKKLTDQVVALTNILCSAGLNRSSYGHSLL